MPHLKFFVLRSVIAAIVAFVAEGAFAQEPVETQLTLRTGTPEQVDVNPEGLRRAVSVIQHAVEDREIPGAVVLVARRGRVILHEAIGYRDVANQESLTTNALFRMASNSKAVTATGIMLLVDDGTVQLDDPIGKHLPAFDNESWRQVTIRHLLTHTSGFRYGSLFVRPLLKAESENSQESQMVREVNRFAEISIEFEPGTTYSYNNAGYNILAGLIEQLTGSYRSFLSTRIYEPLGMRDSSNHESSADRRRMSPVLIRQDDGNWKTGWRPTDPPDWPFARGSGGMVSTAWDYALFCQLLLNHGHSENGQILKNASIDEMTTPQFSHCPAATDYGLGWVVHESGGTFSHTGSDGTYVWVDPKREIIGMVLTQTNRTTIPRTIFRQLIEQACVDGAADREQHNENTNLRRDGFYKDIFMSGGKHLTSRKVLPAAESLNLDYEFYAGADAAWQNQMIIGSDTDENGVLLYPDGAPRFKLIYVNGGSATAHGKSLTRSGRDRIRTFSHAGGSYCGSCAGAFLSGRNVDQGEPRRLGYLHLFPYNTLNTGIKKTNVNHQIPSSSPLHHYRDFGSDNMVENVYHNGGNWLRNDASLPDVEVLATYELPQHKIDGGTAIWAFHPDENRGRIVDIGSHPEGAITGEKLALMEACILYGLDGTGKPKLKPTLENGERRAITATSKDNNPDFARIGDLQYHHFAFDVDESRPWVEIIATADEHVKLRLFVAKESLAFADSTELADSATNETNRFVQHCSPGRWYVSVFCDTSVETIADPDSGFHRYIGDRSILNGAAYSIELHQSENNPMDGRNTRNDK
ncbi:MAG: serine hydrolase [Pirellulaceae bacterium]